MAGKPKPKATQAFEDNIADAHSLVALARSLSNRRVKRMRRELRERIGAAMRVPKGKWDDLDCVESEDLFVVFPPGARMSRDDFTAQALRPLLRQALVAGCTAVETFVGDRVIEKVGPALRQDPVPAELEAVPMTVGDWLDIDATYERGRWGVRKVAEAYIRDVASPAPSSIARVFKLVGERDLWKRVDRERGRRVGTSERELQRVYARRNKIAHVGDRVGRQRAAITVEEVDADLDELASIIGALDKATA